MTVGLRWDNKILPSGHGISKKYPSGLCEITKKLSLGLREITKKISLGFCIAITKNVGDYKYFTFGWQWDRTITVGLHFCSKD